MEKRIFDANWIDQLKQRCDIVSVLSKYLTVERKGKNFWACCPFHNEKTPSFCINSYDQFYHCFGCKESGDVITFIMKYESLDYYDAVVMLAKQCGLELPELKDGQDIINQKKKQDRVKQVLQHTAEFFHKSLYDKSASLAQQYLLNRKIVKSSIENFKIGYSPNWTSLIRHLKDKGFTYSEMKQAGVAEEKNNNTYDVMANRLMFPIFNSKGEVIAFSGRVLEKTDFAKYKNTTQTIVFNKSRAIYGIDKVKTKKQQNQLENIILVEGQVDVITMHQFGFNQTVATLGTALTEEHVPELKRFTDKIVICFDGDEAGIKATLRAIDILKDFNLKVVSLPQKSDPDEFLHSYGAKELQNLIDNADDGIEFKIKNKARQSRLDTNDERAKFVKEAIEILNALKTNSQKYVYLKLISSISGVPIDILSADINKQQTNQTKPEIKEQPVQIKTEENIEKAVKFVLASLIHKKEYASVIFPRYVIVNPEYEIIYDLIIKAKNNNEDFVIGNLYNYFDDKNPLINDLIHYNFNVIGNNAIQYYKDCVWTFCEHYLKEKQKLLNIQHKECNSDQGRKEILLKIQKINQQLKNKNLEED